MTVGFGTEWRTGDDVELDPAEARLRGDPTAIGRVAPAGSVDRPLRNRTTLRVASRASVVSTLEVYSELFDSLSDHPQHAPSTVHRIWRAFGLQPHRVETFKLSTDLLFVEKVRDIVGLCLSPPERAIVLCVDESRHVSAWPNRRSGAHAPHTPEAVAPVRRKPRAGQTRTRRSFSTRALGVQKWPRSCSILPSTPDPGWSQRIST